MHIYKFTHIETGRCYIGQTIQEPNQRRLEHISGSRHTDRTYHFHNALRKYGVSAFTFEVIDTVKSLEELNAMLDGLNPISPADVTRWYQLGPEFLYQ